MKPKIVLVVTDKDLNKDIKAKKPDMIEVRVDLFKKRDAAYVVAQLKMRRQLKIPILLTVRNDKKEGAQKSMTDATKWGLIESAMPHVQWIDIELSSKLCSKTIELAKAWKKKIVVSAHNFKSTPTNIESLYKKAKATKAQAIKFAFCAKNEKDVWSLIEFTQKHRREEVVTMCVGAWGAVSRLILPELGSRWVYTFLNTSTAPGQMDINTLRFFRQITQGTTAR